MIRYHVKALFRDLYAAMRGKGPWFEAKYHALSVWDDFIHPARCVLYGLRNLYAYAPLIWHDRDWDYSSMLDLWELKFRRMAHQHLVYGNHVGHEEMARTLRVAASLCQRIREDNYADADHERHAKRWGQLGHYSMETENPRLHRMEFFFPKAYTKDEIKLADETWHRYMRHAEAQKVRDIKYLTFLVNKHLLRWWD